MTFRSQKMDHYQLIIPRQIAWDATNELGKLDMIHLEDISNPLIKPFSLQVKRCQDSLYKIRVIKTYMKKKGLFVNNLYLENDEKYLNKLMEKWQQQSKQTNTNQIKRINVIEEKVDQAWSTYQDITVRLEKLNHNLTLNKGKIAAFKAVSKVFGENYFAAKQDIFDNYSSSDHESIDLRGLSYFISIVKSEEELKIVKMVFRISKGYAWVNFIHADTFRQIPELTDFKDTVMILFYPNSSEGIVQKKLSRIVDSFSIETFRLPDNEKQFIQEWDLMRKQYFESKDIMRMLNKQSLTYVDSMNQNNKLQEWEIFFIKEKALYDTLNKMEIRDQFTIAKFYIPSTKSSELIKITAMTPTPILNKIALGKPPSYFQINDFTYPGQQITETYGVPRYQEMNPGIFTCITFPFLFGVMFGDIAHGFVLFMFGTFLVLGNDKLKSTPFKYLLNVRYMIILMGFFAFYCGFIYNDFMGIGLNLFGSCYKAPMFGEKGEIVKSEDPQCEYEFGIDPIWYRTENELMFMNSLKMKIAVILGVIHMSFGIVLKAVNSLHFKKHLDFYFQFIPQITFMVLMFGYMDFLIIFKWLKPWQWPNDEQKNWPYTPSIITTLINVPLKLGKTTDQFGGQNMWGNSPDDTSQNTIQLVILAVSLVCIPLMLIPKPWIEISRMKKKKTFDSQVSQRFLNEDARESQIHSQLEALRASQPEHQQHHADTSQIIVHQIIETIEFILGCISNTASYLRLWALSLAHSQLSQVFLNKTVEGGFAQGYSSIYLLVFGFYLLAYVTFGVLLCMDTMQCFLHSLRLHWVEFQNKFFKADGIKFVPFSFKQTIKQSKESQQE